MPIPAKIYFNINMDISSIRLNNLLTLKKRYRTQAELAEAVNTDPAYISQILGRKKRGTEGARNIGNDFARKIEDRLNLPYGWRDQTHDIDSKSQSASGKVPLVSWEIVGVLNPKLMQDENEWIKTSGAHGPHAFALQIEGDSNAPDFTPGTVIIVDPDLRAKPGNFVVAKLGKILTMRELVKDGTEYALKPVNPRYPVHALSDGEIIGIVCEAISIRRLVD